MSVVSRASAGTGRSTSPSWTRGHLPASAGAATRAARPSRNSRIRAWASSELDATAAMSDSRR